MEKSWAKLDESEDESAIIKRWDSKDDHKSEYGDVEYADPEDHKYPIDNEKHIRAAWSYINQQCNQTGAPAGKISAIKSKIRAAAKKHGIHIEDEKETEKSMSAEALQKLDSLSQAVATLTEQLGKLNQAQPDLAKLQSEIGDLQKRQTEAAEQLVKQERETIIFKMDSDGRVAFKDDGTAYTHDDLMKMDLPLLKFAARNSTVLPTEARAVYKGGGAGPGKQFTGHDGKPLRGSELIEKAWENTYGDLSKMLATPVGQTPRLN
ncbi:MAG: hypothetical protein KGL39_47480 [Patescibacteria group bacterium]|nr:hypothetical protein [Patescibacteria group bacterium]